MPAYAHNFLATAALIAFGLGGCRSGIQVDVPVAGDLPSENRLASNTEPPKIKLAQTEPAGTKLAPLQISKASGQSDSHSRMVAASPSMRATAAKLVSVRVTSDDEQPDESDELELPQDKTVDSQDGESDSNRDEEPDTNDASERQSDTKKTEDESQGDDDASSNRLPVSDSFDDWDTLNTGRPLSVAEAIQVALSQNKSILVLGHVPREASTFCSTEQAAFDPVFEAGIAGGKTDRQLSNFIDGGGLTPTDEQQTDFLRPVDRNQLSISKLLETGGTVEGGVSTDYLFQDPLGGFALINPAWRSALNFRLSQPLGRGRGSDVTTAPLRIAQANQRQATHQFQSRVNVTLRDVQLAYWDWKLAQQQMNVRQRAVDQAAESVEQEQKSLELGDGTLPDVQQAEDQLQRFRIELAVAKNAVAQNKIALANVMGVLPSETFFDFAIDEPLIYVEPIREVGEMAARLRPELMAANAQIKAAELEVKLANDSLRPDLNMRFDYAVSGLEDRLDDSIDTVLDNQYNDWALQFEYRRAAGLRSERALASRSRIRLSRLLAQRREIEQAVQADVARAWQELETARSVMQLQARRVEIARQQVNGRETLYREGEGTLDQKVRAEAALVDAILARIQSEVSLQQAIVRWEYATGQQSHVAFTGNE